MRITRRIFLRNGALAVAGTAAIPSFLTRAAYGALESGNRAKRLVVIFQRGAADGLNIVVPHGEQAYYSMRPSINIPRSSVLDLDGFFGLHPALSPLQPIWNQRHLAIVHAAGSPDPTRSHFDAQDFMESGTPGVKATDDGWLNRALHALPDSAVKSAFRAIALGPSLPRILSGPEPTIAVNNINDFAEDTVVVTMSEFGRTARENGNRGTDHGHANVMFVMGGPVRGGKVYGRWPGLDQSQLYEGRDLAITTDFRRVLGEAVFTHLGNKSLDQVFPGFDNQQGKFLRLLS